MIISSKPTGRAPNAFGHKRRILRKRPVLAPFVEHLEQRTLLATFTVNDLTDVSTINPDITTLRKALTRANATGAADVIRFDSSLFENGGQQTISLFSGNLPITRDVTIYGPGSNSLAISGGNQIQTGGGGVFDVAADTDVTIFGLEITEGVSEFTGGGINNEGNLTLDHVVLSNNRTSGQRGAGGAISNTGELTISHSTLSNNQADFGGGVFSIGDSNDPNAVFVVMENTTLMNNVANDTGGGIRSLFGNTVIANSTFSGNSSAGNGGGLAVRDAPLSLTNVTVTGNRANSDGNGLQSGGGLHAAGGSSVELNNTLIIGNFGGPGSTPDDLSLPASEYDATNSHNNIVGDPATAGAVVHRFNRNIVGDGFGGILSVDDVLNTTIQDIGGPTLVHPLALNSPAIDGGNNFYTSDQLPTFESRFLQNDQRGFHYNRFVDGTNSGRTTVDVGAVEHQFAPAVVAENVFVVSTIGDGFNDGVYENGQLSLREALLLSDEYPDPNVITFAPHVRGEIGLFVGELTAKYDVRIIGPGARPYFSPADEANLTAEQLDDFTQSTLTISGRDSSRVLTVQETARVDISGLTFSDGLVADNGSQSQRGGGLSNLGDTTLADVVIKANQIVGQSSFGGGGLFNSADGNMTLRNVTVAGNQALQSAGGGILNAGTLRLEDGTTLIENSAFRGGGLFSFNGSAGLSDVLVLSNTVTGNGAGISNFADMEIFHTKIEENVSTGREAKGGGIYIDGGGDTTITESIIFFNQLPRGDASTGDIAGGGIYAVPNVGTVLIERSIMHFNEAFQGGGLASGPVGQGTVILDNSTVSRNIGAFQGAGVLVRDTTGVTRISNSTLALNGNGFIGRDVGQVTNFGRIGQLSNSLLVAVNDTGTRISAIEAFNNGVFSGRRDHNLITPYNTPSTGADFTNPSDKNLLNVDPLIRQLATQPGSFTATHELDALSPAIDAGFSGSGSERRILDQTGRPTVDVATKPNATNGDDIGAYEAQLTSNVQDWESETINSQGGTAVSQFVESNSEVMYGLGFDDGRRPHQGNSGLDHKPGFLGIDWNVGPDKEGYITPRHCIGGGSFLGVSIPEICTPSFGGEVNFEVDVRIGLEYGYYVNAGSVEAFYEGQFLNTINEVKNPDGSLNVARIDTNAKILDGSLYTISPRFGAFVDLVAEFKIIFGGRICVFACLGGNILNINESYREQLFGINRQLREGDEGTSFNDFDNIDYTGLPLPPDTKEPLFLKQGGGFTTNPRNLDGSFNPPAFSGKVEFLQDPLGSLLKKGVEKAYDKLKDRFDAVGRAENKKKQNEKKLNKTTDVLERDRLRREIAENDKDLAKAKKEKREQEKKRDNAQCLGASKGITCEFSQADEDLLGAKVTIGAGAKVKGVGVSKEIGSLTVTIPDIQLSDTNLDNAAGKLSATTDAFIKGSKQDEKRQAAKLRVDVAGLLGPLVGIPAGKYKAEALGVSVEAQLFSYNIETTLAVTQDVEVNPFLNDPSGVVSSPGPNVAAFQFTNPVDVSVNFGPFRRFNLTTTADHDADPATPNVPATAPVPFFPSQRVEVKPVGAQTTTVIPSMKLGNSFYNNIGLDIDVKGIFEALSLKIPRVDIDVGPLWDHTHSIGTFDLGSVWSDRFALSTAPVAGLKPFTIGGGTSATMDGKTPAGAIALTNQTTNIVDRNTPVWFSVPVVSDTTAFDQIEFRGNGTFGDVTVSETGLILEALDGSGIRQQLQPGVPAAGPFGNFRIRGILGSTTTNQLLIAVTSSSSGGSSSIVALPGAAENQSEAVQPFVNLALVEEANANYVENDLALDIDGDGIISPWTDGKLLENYMPPNNLRGDDLIRGAVNPNGTRTTAPEIEAYIASLPGGLTRLDLNGGGADAVEDGQQILRHFSGLSDINLDDLPDDANALATLDGTNKDAIYQAQFDASGVEELRNGADINEFNEIRADGLEGSSAHNPIDASDGAATFLVNLDTYGQTIQYVDTYVTDADDPTQRTLVSTGAAGSPARTRGAANDEFSAIDVDDDALVESLVNRSQTETRSAQLGSDEPIFVKLRDAAGYEFAAPNGFQFTRIDFDSAAGDNPFYDHNLSEDGTEFDFDVYLPESNTWLPITINATDQPIDLANGNGVSRFQLFPTQLADAGRRGLEDNELPDIDLTIGLVLRGPTSTPTITISQLGERKPLVVPDRHESSPQNFTIYSADYYLRRDGAELKPVFTEVFRNPLNLEEPDPNRPPRVTELQMEATGSGVTAPIPLSSLKSIEYRGGHGQVDDTLIVDSSSNGRIDIPIVFNGNSSFDDEFDPLTGKKKHDPLIVDALRVVGDEDVTVDIIGQYILGGVSLVDLRGSAKNTLVLDSTAVSVGASAELYVLVDDNGPGADIVDMSASDWNLDPEPVQENFRGTVYTFDHYEAVGFPRADLYISRGAPSAPPFIPPSTSSAPPEIPGAGVVGPLPLFSSGSAPPDRSTQIVNVSADDSTVAAGESVEVDVFYNYTGNLPPNGLSIQVHYDSTKLDFNRNTGLSLQVTDGYIGSTTPPSLPENVSDNSSTTDSIIELIWSGSGNWLPGATSSTKLATLTFTAKESFDSSDLTVTRSVNPLFEFESTGDIIQVTPPVIVVDNPVDENDGNTNPGDLSLREAIALGGPAVVQFSPTLFGQTLQIGSALQLTDKVSIEGPGADRLTIRGSGNSRIFDVGSNVTANLSGLTVQNGASNSGGAIQNAGTLHIRELAVNQNNSSGEGGGIANTGTMTIANSEISQNDALNGVGGGVFNSGTLSVVNTTLSGNRAAAGGGLGTAGGTTTLRNNTITGNHATAGGLSPDSGGGLRIAPLGSVEMHNSIVVGNTSNGANANIDGVLTGQSSNLIGGSVANVLNTTLADNGGPTRSHALVANSLARDTGSNAAAKDANGFALTSDQTGGTRFFGTSVDIGALESGAPAPGFRVTESDNNTTVSESGTTDTLDIVLTAPPATNVTVIVASTDPDEVKAATFLTFSPGNWDVPQTATLTGVPDGDDDGTQIIPVTVSVVDDLSASRFAALPDQSINVSVTDTGGPRLPTVTIVATDPTASEQGRDPGTFTVTRDTVLASSLTVQFNIGGSATNGSDYNSIDTTVRIAGNSASATITINPVDDDDDQEGTETVQLQLVDDSNYLVGTPDQATVEIRDNDSGGGQTDIVAKSYTTGNSPADTVLNYEILGAAPAQFQVAFFTSKDTALDASDIEVGGRITLSAAADLAIGSHSLNIDQQSLDTLLTNFNLRFLLAVIDPDNAVTESDEANNTQNFSGLFHTSGQIAAIHGNHHVGPNPGPANDVIALDSSGGSTQFDINGRQFDIPSSTVPQIVALLNGGDDSFDAEQTVNIPIKLRAGSGVDDVRGGAANDLLIGQADGDRVRGGEGADRIQGGKGNDELRGGPDNDTMNGGKDDDSVFGNDGNDRMVGSTGNDTLLGGLGKDTANGMAGDDELRGGDEDDRLLGGFGSDLIFGERGNDALMGMTHVRTHRDNVFDRIFGGSGNDRLLGLRDRDDILDSIERDLRKD